MVGHGRSSARSYLANPASPIPSHCASIVLTSTVRVKAESIYLSVCIQACFMNAAKIGDVFATNIGETT